MASTRATDRLLRNKRRRVCGGASFAGGSVESRVVGCSGCLGGGPD